MWQQAWREGLRSLRLDARVALTAVALLAVTIGAITAVFAIVQAIVLRPFPFADQDRVAIIWQRDDRRAMPVMEVAYGEMEDWRTRSAQLRLARRRRLGELEPRRSSAMASRCRSRWRRSRRRSSPSSARRRQIGRALEPADEVGNLPTAMVISHGLWTRRYGGDPKIVGQAVRVQLQADKPPVAMTIAGVMPAAFDYPRGADAWVPAVPLVRTFSGGFWRARATRSSGCGVFYALGRIAAGRLNGARPPRKSRG